MRPQGPAGAARDAHLRVGVALLLPADVQGALVVLPGLVQAPPRGSVPSSRVQTQTQEEAGFLPEGFQLL